MIYFIQDEATCHIKIGFTSHSALERMRSLQTASPSRLVLLLTLNGSKEDEGRLHAKFRSARGQGEWFRPVPELIQFLLSRHPGIPPVQDSPRPEERALSKVERDLQKTILEYGLDIPSPAPRPPAPPQLSYVKGGITYSLHQPILHPTYGRGHITEISGEGALRKVHISFLAAGVRIFITDKVDITPDLTYRFVAQVPPASLLSELRASGFVLRAEHGRLLVSPASALTSIQRAAVKGARDGLLAELERERVCQEGPLKNGEAPR